MNENFNILDQLFVNWDLGTWANILEVLGFLISIITLFVNYSIKSEINKLKISYLFDKRAKSHIENLSKSASNINDFLNDYDNNRSQIKTEFGKCISELEDIKTKISSAQSKKIRKLISFLNQRKKKPFAQKANSSSTLTKYIKKYLQRLYQTTEDDVYLIHDSLIEIVRQLENIKQNKQKSL